MPVQPIPPGFHTITPYLVANDAAKLIDFLENAFGAQIKHISKGSDGLVMHATLQIGNSMLMLGDSRDQWPARPTGMYLYVPNVDELYQRAIKAGGESVNAPRDEFYGDRMAGIKDHAGNFWWIATHIEDVSEEEMTRRRDKLFGAKK